MKPNTSRKVKVSVTISEDILATVDQYAQQNEALTRSSVIECWLRESSKREAERKLERDTNDYYAALSSEASDKDDTWAQASSRYFASLDFD
jgi:metal-responsive CopG/Arc/MetJ family transcriptional regulator